jgi:hypothetical protein
VFTFQPDFELSVCLPPTAFIHFHALLYWPDLRFPMPRPTAKQISIANARKHLASRNDAENTPSDDPIDDPDPPPPPSRPKKKTLAAQITEKDQQITQQNNLISELHDQLSDLRNALNTLRLKHNTLLEENQTEKATNKLK